jgi:hypothetical protein
MSMRIKPPWKKPLSAFWPFCIFLLLCGCGEEQPSCDSSEARNLVVKTVADNKNNSLLNYAVRNSNVVAAMVANSAGADAEKSVILEKAKEGAVYALDGTAIADSQTRATRTVSCSGLLSVTVEDTTAQKQVDFTVEQPANGTVHVSVKPFLF